MKKKYAFIPLAVIAIAIAFSFLPGKKPMPVFDVHLHGQKNMKEQLKSLEEAGVTIAAVSTSWNLQSTYAGNSSIRLLYGLMVPCPGGKVPYSQQQCFDDGKEWPNVAWVEQQVKAKKIDFIGEVLTQYHGISSADEKMFPYYALAEKYGLPVGVHTGSAGPDHGCPTFREDMGDPALLKPVMQKFPSMKLWIMHAGGPFLPQAIELMKAYPTIYTDISAVNNPAILPPAQFAGLIKMFVNAGLEDRLMFGSDNAPIKTVLEAIDQLDFLTPEQKQKIVYENATRFFQPAASK
ncbi:MAG: amidohydrolase family protein [Ferruginibacter sp.]|nr:amidohydrolase family protein [Ferruginibacter sp.]